MHPESAGGHSIVVLVEKEQCGERVCDSQLLFARHASVWLQHPGQSHQQIVRGLSLHRRSFRHLVEYSVHERPKGTASAGVSELPQGLGLDLADSLACALERYANTLRPLRRGVVQTER